MTTPFSWSLGPIEPQKVLRIVARYRVRRAVDRGRRSYVVTGGREPYFVDLDAQPNDWCDCAHATFAEAVCVHVLAVLLFENDTRLVHALGAAMRGAWLDQPPPLPQRDVSFGVIQT